jgi:hypothetical protein
MADRSGSRRAFLARLAMSLGASPLVPRAFPGAVQNDGNGGESATTLALRKEELRRRVAALPAEIKRWRTRAERELEMKLHFSQLGALDVLMSAILAAQEQMVADLKPEGDSKRFLEQAATVVNEIIRAQGVWDFYREKLQLRFSPDFKTPLRVADAVAWDCYHPVLDQAADLDILPRSQLREPPLCYYWAGFTPQTWARGSEPNDLRDRQGASLKTPIPVIALPWDHAENLWESLSIPHEVGHDLEADLRLHEPLLQALDGALRDGKTPEERIQRWKGWKAETLADLVALQLVGPSYTDMLMHLLLLPPADVTAFEPDPHPTPYLRVLMNVAYIRQLISGDDPAQVRARRALGAHADRIEAAWKRLYGDPKEGREYLADFPLVFTGLMNTPLAPLKDKGLRDLVPYTPADDLRIRAAAEYLESGQGKPGRLRPRHCIAGARLAVSDASRRPGDVPAALRAINDRTAKLVNENAPQGLLGGGDLKERRQLIYGFAGTISTEEVERRRRP